VTQVNKISLVVVDDHPIFLAGLQQLFRKQADFDVVGVAENIMQLEELLGKATPSVVLMDIELPQGDGISATAFVRKQSPGTKVVMLTGYDNPDLIFRALKAGAVGYLLKNARFQEILKTLRRVAAGEMFLNPELAGKFLREFQRDQEVEELRRLVQTLSPREEEVLRFVAMGETNREISHRLFISELTVKMHIASIFRKLQVNDRTKAAVLALRAGLGTI
jgi:two-component system, NarL family, response regulator DegU